MTEPLVVDSSRLKAAGKTLQEIVFPAPPPTATMGGADAVSAAIRETLPIIESPVNQGLPAVKAAIQKTASSIVTAADLYAETDQALGEQVGGVEFLAAAREPATRPSTGQPVGATADRTEGGEAPSKPEPEPGPNVPPANDITKPIGQPNGAAQALGPATQSLQTIMSGVQQATGSTGSTAASPAQLVDDTATTDPPAIDDRDQRQEGLAEGAAPGGGASGTAPVPPATPSTPETAPSGVEL